MRKHLSKALALTLAMSSLASVSLAEGSVLNVWCWNDEFQSRFNAYYPEVKEVAEDKSTTTLNDGTIVKWTINPNADNNYQNKLDEALLAQESAADDDKIDMFLIEADYALKYVDSPYTLDVRADIGLTDDELCEMGLKLGADVPFCLRGGTMLAQGIGEELSLLPDMPHCWVVLCKPPFAVPTKEVYQEIDSVDILEHPDNKGMMAALNQGDYEGVCAYLSNVMETVTAAKRRQIGEIKSFLAENGADGTLMSGSGPTVYGLFSDESRAKTAAKMLRRRFADTFLTETCN